MSGREEEEKRARGKGLVMLSPWGGYHAPTN